MNKAESKEVAGANNEPQFYLLPEETKQMIEELMEEQNARLENIQDGLIRMFTSGAVSRLPHREAGAVYSNTHQG